MYIGKLQSSALTPTQQIVAATHGGGSILPLPQAIVTGGSADFSAAVIDDPNLDLIEMGAIVDHLHEILHEETLQKEPSITGFVKMHGDAIIDSLIYRKLHAQDGSTKLDDDPIADVVELVENFVDDSKWALSKVHDRSKDIIKHVSPKTIEIFPPISSGVKVVHILSDVGLITLIAALLLPAKVTLKKLKTEPDSEENRLKIQILTSWMTSTKSQLMKKIKKLVSKGCHLTMNILNTLKKLDLLPYEFTKIFSHVNSVYGWALGGLGLIGAAVDLKKNIATFKKFNLWQSAFKAKALNPNHDALALSIDQTGIDQMILDQKAIDQIVENQRALLAEQKKEHERQINENLLKVYTLLTPVTSLLKEIQQMRNENMTNDEAKSLYFSLKRHILTLKKQDIHVDLPTTPKWDDPYAILNWMKLPENIDPLIEALESEEVHITMAKQMAEHSEMIAHSFRQAVTLIAQEKIALEKSAYQASLAQAVGMAILTTLLFAADIAFALGVVALGSAIAFSGYGLLGLAAILGIIGLIYLCKKKPQYFKTYYGDLIKRRVFCTIPLLIYKARHQYARFKLNQSAKKIDQLLKKGTTDNEKVEKLVKRKEGQQLRADQLHETLVKHEKKYVRLQRRLIEAEKLDVQNAVNAKGKKRGDKAIAFNESLLADYLMEEGVLDNKITQKTLKNIGIDARAIKTKEELKEALFHAFGSDVATLLSKVSTLDKRKRKE